MPVLLSIANILTWLALRQAIRWLHVLEMLLKKDIAFEVFDE